MKLARGEGRRQSREPRPALKSFAFSSYLLNIAFLQLRTAHRGRRPSLSKADLIRASLRTFKQLRGSNTYIAFT